MSAIQNKYINLHLDEQNHTFYIEHTNHKTGKALDTLKQIEKVIFDQYVYNPDHEDDYSDLGEQELISFLQKRSSEIEAGYGDKIKKKSKKNFIFKIINFFSKKQLKISQVVQKILGLNLDDMPSEISQEILKYLPLSDLLSFSKVSRKAHAEASSAILIRAHNQGYTGHNIKSAILFLNTLEKLEQNGHKLDPKLQNERLNRYIARGDLRNALLYITDLEEELTIFSKTLPEDNHFLSKGLNKNGIVNINSLVGFINNLDIPSILNLLASPSFHSCHDLKDYLLPLLEKKIKTALAGEYRLEKEHRLLGREILLTAIKNKDVETLKLSLLFYPSLKESLHMAAKEGFIDGIDLLLNAGASVDARDSFDRIPLHYAVATGNYDLVKKLCLIHLDQEFNEINAQDYQGLTPLALACINDENRPLPTDLIKVLLYAWADAYILPPGYHHLSDLVKTEREKAILDQLLLDDQVAAEEFAKSARKEAYVQLVKEASAPKQREDYEEINDLGSVLEEEAPPQLQNGEWANLKDFDID